MNAPALRLPPHSIEAEQSLIGALLLDNNAWDRIEGTVTDADFFRDDHRRIFTHIAALIRAGKPADVVTVHAEMEQSGEAERCGGLAYLGEIANNTPSAANIRAYATTIRDRAYRRMGQGDTEALAVSYAAGAVSHDEFAAGLERIAAQAIDSERDDPLSLADSMHEAMALINDRANGGGVTGLQSGIPDLDALTGGFEPGQLIILAARPGVGKTALALGIADQAARADRTVLFMSLEMPARELSMRVMAQRSGVSVHAMRTGTRNDDHWSALTRVSGEAARQRLFIDDRGGIGLAYVRARAKRLARKHGLHLIVVDYIGLMRGEGQNRAQELGSISRGLKALAKELAVPIIACAQLNRAVESRSDRRPQLHDLRDSGEIEQDADIVLMLDRPEMTNSAPEWHGVGDLLLRKHRNGPTGEVRLRYIANRTLFVPGDGYGPARDQAIPRDAMYRGYRDRGFDG
ncbi:MAG: replicative DNA helicase [Methyloversatilis discipulorum]|uniref:replicative DNA helicase n=1 Tax=Methyloversatilis discipulorum TaxID=1119528 RepID=UPI0026F15840|nr:replicative DNA helicase [Methyloversatilis discipulorum]MBT9516526.1 replicative DNA helicase [Methyloversatilis discipulorum]